MLLSFVVPCYNVEKNIQRCLDSIYACDLSEDKFEVLCVNDCSPDGTQIILEENRKCHGNLRIIVHEFNKGPGGARNTGISGARGDYIWFVDSDDEIQGGCLKDVLDRICNDNLDIMTFNYRLVDSYGNEKPLQYLLKDIPVQNGTSFAKTAFEGGIALNMGYVVRFIYKTAFLRSHNLQFPEKVCWEYTVFMPKSIILAQRVAAVSPIMYTYWMNPGSISNTFRRAYPARMIFEFSFDAGNDVLRLSEEVEDEELCIELRNAAINRYINYFPINLFRTNRVNRKKFYELVNERKKKVAELKAFMKPFSKVLLLPVVGKVVAECGTFLYRIKHVK